MHLDETNVSCVCVHVCAVLMCVWVHVCVGWAFIIVFTVSSPQEESRMFLIWEKALSLLVRQVKFSGSVPTYPTHAPTHTLAQHIHVHTHNSHWFHQGAPLHNLTGNTILMLYTSALGQ